MLPLVYSHACIIQGNDYESFKSEIRDSHFEYLAFDYNIDKKETSLKMEDIEKMKTFQNSKSSNKRYVITNRSIRNTIIQNAMLKLLEEPSSGVVIVLFVEDVSMIISTVLSRCQIIKSEATGDDERTISKIIKNKNDKNRFLKLERYLRLDNLNKRGLVSDSQLEDYKGLL